MPPPTPMVPTGILARGLLRLRLSPRLMLMLLTTALLATLVWDTPTTDTMDTGPMLPLPTPGLLATPPPTPTTTDSMDTGHMPLPLPTAMALGLMATLPPTPM